MRREMLPLVEQAVTDTGTDNGREDHDKEEFVHRTLGQFLLIVNLAFDPIAQQEPHRPHQSVPADRKRAKVQQFRIPRPSNKTKHNKIKEKKRKVTSDPWPR